MIYLDFITPKIVMKRIFLEVFVGVRGVGTRGSESGDCNCAVEGGGAPVGSPYCLFFPGLLPATIVLLLGRHRLRKILSVIQE